MSEDIRPVVFTTTVTFGDLGHIADYMAHTSETGEEPSRAGFIAFAKEHLWPKHLEETDLLDDKFWRVMGQRDVKLTQDHGWPTQVAIGGSTIEECGYAVAIIDPSTLPSCMTTDDVTLTMLKSAEAAIEFHRRHAEE